MLNRILCLAAVLWCLACNDASTAAANRDVDPLPNAKADPVEQEFMKLLAEDDAAQEEVDRWIRDNDAFEQAGARARPRALQTRIRERLGRVRKGYEDFLQRNPQHARAHLAFGSFLNDNLDEGDAEKHWERARELNPSEPAAWNNLANHYGHAGPVGKAFRYYEKAISLNPKEPVYYQNLATTVYLFRQAAMEHFKCDEEQVFAKSLELYRQAVRLAPADFPLATDYAQTYYGIRPMRTDDALAAWTNAFGIAHDEVERQGVHVHFARIKMNAGQLAEARAHLNAITNAMYDTIRTRLLRNLAEKESGTNAPTSSAPTAATRD